MLDGLFLAGAAGSLSETSKSDTTGQMASRIANEVRSKAESMQYDVEKLFMIAEALWDILKEHHGYTDDELIRRITEIDFSDGKVAKSAPIECPNCARKLTGKRPRCLYCGALIKTDPFCR